MLIRGCFPLNVPINHKYSDLYTIFATGFSISKFGFSSFVMSGYIYVIAVDRSVVLIGLI